MNLFNQVNLIMGGYGISWNNDFFFLNKNPLNIGNQYRIIYKYTSDNELEILYIMDIGSRGDIYK